MSKLFSPIKIKDITFRNRIGVAPMCQYSSENGYATDWHMVHLGSRAVGGAGLVIAEATAVSPEGRITPGCAGIWEDGQIEPLIPINAFIKKHGAVPAIQIAHAGRKAGAARPWDGGTHLTEEAGGWQSIGPAAEPFDPDRLWRVPVAMDEAEIKRVQTSFRDAAVRSLEAGYELLEIHAAHGYLLHSFSTPLVNSRTDGYGGDLHGRTRMLRETVAAVREVWPENLPLAVRLSASDWVPEGNQIGENVQIAIWLKELGVDVIDCSAGGATPLSRTALSGIVGDQIELADQIRAEAGIATMAVGGITESGKAEAIIADGKADFALLARELLRDPYWPYHAAVELGVDKRAVLPEQNAFFVG
jgi:2,4-dienoyl-CoA reductase-like NADH-dependent reductase (Old Yellow Enzyme family)